MKPLLALVLFCSIARADVPEVSQYPSLFRLAYSGALCALVGDRLDVLDEIKAQSKLDAQSGVVDLRTRANLRMRLADLEDRAARLRLSLAEDKQPKPLACSVEKVGELLTCMSNIDGECGKSAWRNLAKEANELGGY